MMIRRRAHTPKFESKGRHPLLKPGTSHSIVFNYIHLHPGCSVEETMAGTSRKSNEVAPRVTELKAEGLLEQVGWKIGRNGKRVRTYQTIPHNMTGNKNDKLTVRLDVTCDESGNYFLRSTLIGQFQGLPQGRVISCLTKIIHLTVIPPTKLARNPKLQTFANSALQIEGDYVKVEQ